MKQYNVQVEVTTTYIVEVHAEDIQEANDKAWCMEFEEIKAQGSANVTETTDVGNIEEIQKESGE